MTLILSNDDVEKLLTMRECIDVLEEAYVELAEGRGVSRTRSDCFAPTSREDALYSLKSMDGVIPKFGVGAVRINSDIVTWPKRGNNVRREKIPAAPGNRYVGLVLLFSTETGEPLAIFPDGVMQRMRVGAANGLGVKYLARKDAKTVAILDRVRNEVRLFEMNGIESLRMLEFIVHGLEDSFRIVRSERSYAHGQ